MDEENCLMEEKSLLSSVSTASLQSQTNNSLSGFARAEVPNYTWLPDDLRKKIIENCQDFKTRQGYPVIDWLRQIRANCDFCECKIINDCYTNFHEDIESLIDDSIDYITGEELIFRYYDGEEVSHSFRSIDDELPFDNESKCYINRNCNIERNVGQADCGKVSEQIGEERSSRNGSVWEGSSGNRTVLEENFDGKSDGNNESSENGIVRNNTELDDGTVTRRNFEGDRVLREDFDNGIVPNVIYENGSVPKENSKNEGVVSGNIEYTSIWKKGSEGGISENGYVPIAMDENKLLYSVDSMSNLNKDFTLRTFDKNTVVCELPSDDSFAIKSCEKFLVESTSTGEVPGTDNDVCGTIDGVKSGGSDNYAVECEIELERYAGEFNEKWNSRRTSGSFKKSMEFFEKPPEFDNSLKNRTRPKSRPKCLEKFADLKNSLERSKKSEDCGNSPGSSRNSPRSPCSENSSEYYEASSNFKNSLERFQKSTNSRNSPKFSKKFLNSKNFEGIVEKSGDLESENSGDSRDSLKFSTTFSNNSEGNSKKSTDFDNPQNSPKILTTFANLRNSLERTHKSTDVEITLKQCEIPRIPRNSPRNFKTFKNSQESFHQSADSGNSSKSSGNSENSPRNSAISPDSQKSSKCFVKSENSDSNCCEFSMKNPIAENNLSLAKSNLNVTFSEWKATFNNFDDSQDEEVNSSEDELLFGSCGNLENLETEETGYKYFSSGSLSQQGLLPEYDEETSFEDNDDEHIYENLWAASEICSNEFETSSSTSCETSEFASPEEAESQEITEFRRRKGSSSSDIAGWINYLRFMGCDDEDDFNQWFSSNDAEGKIYFFEENSNESSWVLPTTTKTPTSKSPATTIDKKFDRNSITTNDISLIKNTSSTSLQITHNFANRELITKKSGTSLNDWPQLFDGNMRVLKEGIISRTKITENGKKLRKNWSSSYAVLTELFLLFFKDAKTFITMMKSGGQSSAIAKPDISVDLNGALIEPGERASSRKNVYMISTVLGLQVLIQSDNTSLAAEWSQEIHGVIKKLPSSFKAQVKPTNLPEIRKPNKLMGDCKELDETKRSSKIARSRSMKMNKKLDDSLEDLSGTVAERQTKIKDKLRKFFLRRPTVDALVKNGIYKDEPAFGSYLADVCPCDYPRVPLFVKTCIEVLESNEDNMKTDGLYRASGNLSQIQKIRLQIDQYNLNVLYQEEDVHVLTGALKLFFRELKEPLIPSSFFKEALNASMLKKTTTKIQCFRDIIKALPPPNHDTLQFLLKHLLKVTSYQEHNRMHIPNLAIVFGPTLMWPAEESANMALDLMQQNLVIECLLSEYNKIFK